jgi:hypothetical protein
MLARSCQCYESKGRSVGHDIRDQQNYLRNMADMRETRYLYNLEVLFKCCYDAMPLWSA